MARTLARHARNRGSLSIRRQPVPLDSVAAVTLLTNYTILLTFGQAMVLAGIPQILMPGASGVELPFASAAPTPSTVLLTYADPFLGGTFSIPARDPAIRNASGGFVVEQAGELSPPE